MAAYWRVQCKPSTPLWVTHEDALCLSPKISSLCWSLLLYIVRVLLNKYGDIEHHTWLLHLYEYMRESKFSYIPNNFLFLFWTADYCVCFGQETILFSLQSNPHVSVGKKKNIYIYSSFRWMLILPSQLRTHFKYSFLFFIIKPWLNNER